ncbi:hypothetical protein O6H91_12G012800 [Diphasiastrum complanatum]|uniref:Uncharacterized protein n=1 Tax=Diphasiastrum complanatum TaxID=34168 RepID=A0ACC2BZ27_DIPCM|nr:hypothetical protein O6H91_12G012800 [Diphasiastrum complanatum]
MEFSIYVFQALLDFRASSFLLSYPSKRFEGVLLTITVIKVLTYVAFCTCDPKEVRVLLKALAEAGTCASERQVAYKVPLTPYMLEDAIDAIKAAVLRCYPTGLPSDHPLYKELEGVPSNLGLVVDSVQLWWAGKQLQRSRRLCDYTGKNDKTKILVKLL